MINTPERIWNLYLSLDNYKAALGKLGLYEQGEINARFYTGDQWHGASCGGDKPLVRHNIIKRIGDFKISQLISSPVSIRYFAEGFSQNITDIEQIKKLRKRMSESDNTVFSPISFDNETGLMVSALNSYRETVAKRVKLENITELALRDAYIKGTGIIYTYFDGSIRTGLYADKKRTTEILGDIVCERIKLENIFFGDPAITDINKQPFIILREELNREEIASIMKKYGAAESLEDFGDGKITVLTLLYKKNGKVHAQKVTEKQIVRPEFSLGIDCYPISIFSWERRSGCIYGESEVTHLIPNQIAINRMTTASVWSAMTAGMPLMVVNGDIVPNEITNEPGQIIRAYGTTEEIESAVKFINPPDYSSGYISAVNNLIYNTLTQSGANEAALGDIRSNNTSAIVELRDASAKYLLPLKHRYLRFLEDIAIIWLEFFKTLYGKRSLRITDENGSWYFPFDAEKYSSLVLSVSADANEEAISSSKEAMAILAKLYDKGGITASEYLSRLPKELIPGVDKLIGDLRRREEA